MRLHEAIQQKVLLEAATRYRQLTQIYARAGKTAVLEVEARLLEEVKHQHAFAVSRGDVGLVIEGLKINGWSQEVGVSSDLVAARQQVIMEMERWEAIAAMEWGWWHSQLTTIMRLERGRKP